MQGYNELTRTLQWVQSFVVINSKCLGETSCRKFGLITFNFIINPMFDFEHPFARNRLLPLGSGTKDQVLLTKRQQESHFFLAWQFVKDYDVDVRNIRNGVVDITNNVVVKCCK
jgi:hypothetical protein